MCSPEVVRLRAAIDDVQAVEVGVLPDAVLSEQLLAVDAELTRLVAEHARLAAEVDGRRVWAADGSRSCAAWLAHERLRSSGCTASAVRLGRALRRMPATGEALAAGVISPEHARELAACWRFAPAEFADYEATLVGDARDLTFRGFLTVCARWREAVDSHRAEKKASELHDRRHLLLHRRPDGSLWFQRGQLDPVGGEAFLRELERIDRELFEADWADAKAVHGVNTLSCHLRRTPAQRRADALVEMAHRSRTAPADGKRPEPLVSVYVDYETATGPLCELASGTPITPGQLLPLFTRADVERIVFGPGNRVIELGRRARFFTGGLRRAIELRDRQCQFAGCELRADRCQVDHRLEHSRGGETTQENGWLLCDRHNLHRYRQRCHAPPQDDEDVEYVLQRCRQRVRELVA